VPGGLSWRAPGGFGSASRASLARCREGPSSRRSTPASGSRPYLSTEKSAAQPPVQCNLQHMPVMAAACRLRRWAPAADRGGKAGGRRRSLRAGPRIRVRLAEREALDKLVDRAFRRRALRSLGGKNQTGAADTSAPRRQIADLVCARKGRKRGWRRRESRAGGEVRGGDATV